MSNEPSQPFPATRWSLIARATGADADQAATRAALDELLRRYLPALRTHLLLSRRLTPDRADDVLQSFVARRVVEQRLLSRASPRAEGQGKFRTFLLASINHFLIDQIRAERAAKRKMDGPDAQAIGERDVESSGADDDPSRAFDVAWARQVIAQAADQMRNDCASNDRADIWDVFEARVLRPALDGVEPVSYPEIVRRHGYATPEQASNVLVSGRRAFQRALRTVVADYVSDPSQIDEEIRELREVVAGASSPIRPGRPT